jgi:hypothetical protein
MTAVNSVQLLDVPRNGSLVARTLPATFTTIRRPAPTHQPSRRYESPGALESSSGHRLGTLKVENQLRVLCIQLLILPDASGSRRRRFKMRFFNIWPFNLFANKRSQIDDDRDSKLVPKIRETLP